MDNGIWLVICGTEPKAGAFRIKDGRNIIGRGADCDIHLPYPAVSRRHAELMKEDGRLSIRDLGSRNGTFVEGKPVRSNGVAELQIGSSLAIGPVAMDVVHDLRGRERLADDCEETPPAPLKESTIVRHGVDEFGPKRKRVLALLLAGLPEKQIAVQLDMGERTVHFHTVAIYRALGVRSRAELAARFLSPRLESSTW